MLPRTLLLAAVALAGCFTTGSGVIAEEARTLESFTRLRSSGAIDVQVTPGATPSATVVADDNLIPLVETAVDGDTLTIRTTESFVSSNALRVLVTVPSLQSIDVSGSGRVHAPVIEAEELAIEVSGSGSVTVGGHAESLDAALSGSGALDATALTVAKAELAVSGSGGAKVVATERIEAAVSGSGSVRYGGAPAEVVKKSSGSGTVAPL